MKKWQFNTKKNLQIQHKNKQKENPFSYFDIHQRHSTSIQLNSINRQMSSLQKSINFIVTFSSFSFFFLFFLFDGWNYFGVWVWIENLTFHLIEASFFFVINTRIYVHKKMTSFHPSQKSQSPVSTSPYMYTNSIIT